MKRTLSIFIILTIIFAFCSCGNSNSQTDITESGLSDSVVENQLSEGEAKENADTPDYNSIYGDKLDETYKIVLAGAQKDHEYIELEHEGLSGVCEGANYSNLLDNVGYLIKDLNGDGISELIIAVSEEETEYNSGTRILSIFGYADEKVTLIDEFRYRNSMYMLSDGKFYQIGSSGAASSVYALYSLSENNELKCEDMYFTALKGEDYEDIGYYYNPNGNDYQADPDTREVTESEFNDFSDKCSKKEIKLDITPISDWGYAEVEVCLLADAEYPTDLEQFTTVEGNAATRILFTPKGEVNRLKILEVAVEDVDDDGNVTYSFGTLKEYETLSKPLILNAVFYGDMPNNGFAFTDKFGNEIRFTLNLSGEDGSVVTEMFW